jgi:hypothetical protein
LRSFGVNLGGAAPAAPVGPPAVGTPEHTSRVDALRQKYTGTATK